MQKLTQSPIFVLLLVGGPFVLFGLLFSLFVPPLLEQQSDRIGQLPSKSATALADTPVGQAILLEGRISPQNPAQFADFVTFTAEECYTSIDDEIECDLVQKVTPPLLLALPDGPVAIANDTYKVERPSTYTNEGGLNYSGLVAGDVVMAVGEVMLRDGRPRIEAEFITTGTKASYMDASARSARFWRGFGFIFVGIGVLLLGIAAFMGIRN